MNSSFTPELAREIYLSVLANAHRKHATSVGCPADANLAIGLRYEVRHWRAYRE
jgi:hypothetical protein